MTTQVRAAEYNEVAPLRELYRQEAHCQIVCDSAIERGMADPYLLLEDGRIAGYGAVWNRIDAGRLTEFYTLPAVRDRAQAMFAALVVSGGATHIGAQTNLPLLLMMLYDFGRNITTESILFADAGPTALANPGGEFRPSDDGSEWIIESGGEAVASGGVLTHYNPPYGDIYMSVAEGARRRGYGSFIVQELKRVAYERMGRRPAARCNPENAASRRTLEKAGFLPCGRILVAEVDTAAVQQVMARGAPAS